ncbi:MAG: amino acid adenylation domain-containing protein, partial [Betaproteobacteria bacterium]
DKSVYNEGWVHRLTGQLDVGALERALSEIFGRHDVLRTRFAMIRGELHQVVAPASPQALAIEDIGGIPAEEREAHARTRVQREIALPFDLERGPLLRARLYRFAPGEHWLVLTVHHIAFDGWSSAVLAGDLSALYTAFSRRESTPLRELPIQYADYSEWQRERLIGETLERLFGYWTPALADLPALDLPTDRPRPPVASYRGGQVEFEIDEGLTHSLKELSRREGVTLFMTLLAAFQVLLYRWSGQEDVAVGAPIAGRTRVEVEPLIGFFVNTMVLRGDLRGNPSFRAFLARVRGTALDAYAHSDLPFEKLVLRLAPKRDLSRNPLFQVAFRLANTPSTELQLPGLSVQRIDELCGETAKYDLSIGVNEAAGRLRMRADYAVDLFDAVTIERMAGHFRILLQGIVADPAQPISRLPLLTAAERHRMLVAWNDTAVDDGDALPVDRMFAAQALDTPAAIALVHAGEEMTYAELNARSNRLAHHLRALGVGPEVFAGVCIERSPELVVGLLAILKAGGAYVPIDPDYPPERIAWMLADTRAPVLLTQERLRARTPGYAGRTVCVDTDWPTVATAPDVDPPPTATAANLAYVIYTSGSTGQPKGVMVEHRSLTNYMRWTLDACYGSGRGGSPLVHSIAFDGVITTLFGPLLCGQTLFLLPTYGEIDALAAGPPSTVTGRYALAKVTPSHLKLVNQQLDITGAACPTAVLMIGGEALVVRDVAYWQRRFPEVRLINHYGPTEATVGCCTYEIVEPVDGLAGIPIGRPIRNARLYVLDPCMAPVPIGVTGELYIAGAGVARGYLGRPELTAERFVADPFGPAGTRMYRTGDRARWRADGVIELLGRDDDQIKIRGFRVELGEIEAALARHAGVGEALVAAPADERDETARQLVAYVVPRGAVPPNATALRQFLKATLPDYMVPGVYVMLDALPLTPHGKVDRARLPAPGAADRSHADAGVAPRNALEEQVAAIWAGLLGIERIDVHQDFFDIGGHSLLAMQLLSRIAGIAGAEVPMRDFFAEPTIAGLARSLETEIGARAGTLDAGRPAQVPIPEVRRSPRVRVRSTEPGKAG